MHYLAPAICYHHIQTPQSGCDGLSHLKVDTGLYLPENLIS